MIPFETDFLHNLVTILDDKDLKEHGQWSDETLQERYNKKREQIRKTASPPLNWEVEKGKVSPNEDVITPLSTDVGASNSWVVHGKHTETGLPMLANDPHLANAMPAFW